MPVPGYDTAQNAPGVESHAETTTASTDPPAEQQPAPTPQRRTTARRKRRYTDIDNYQLEGLRSGAGDLLGYTAVIAGDRIGRITHSNQPRGWRAHPSGSTTPVEHHGRNPLAPTREKAVIDLLAHLGILGS